MEFIIHNIPLLVYLSVGVLVSSLQSWRVWRQGEEVEAILGFFPTAAIGPIILVLATPFLLQEWFDSKREAVRNDVKLNGERLC